jgi:hypothetical protein
VRNLPKLSFEVTPLGATSSDIPPQGAGGFSKNVDWEPIVLAYHNRELVVPANLRMRVTWLTAKELFNIESFMILQFGQAFPETRSLS